MPIKEGILQLQPSDRWAVCRPGHKPIEKGREYRGLTGEYCSADGYWLRDGVRAAML